MLYLSKLLLTAILFGTSYAVILPNFAAEPYVYKTLGSDDFTLFWNQVVYKEINILNNTKYLHVDNLATLTQVKFKVYIDKTVPVVRDNLLRSTYLVLSDPIQQRTFVIQGYLDSKGKNYVVKNIFSPTGYSKATGDGKGKVVFEDYNPAIGVQNYTRKVQQTIKTDDYGNKFIQSNDHEDIFYYPIYNESKSNLPIVFDELTGDVLLVHRKTSDSDLKFYSLEFDNNGNWKAMDYNRKTNHYVQVNQQGIIVFSSKPFPKANTVSTRINNVATTSDVAVTRVYEQYIEVNNQGQSFLASVDKLLQTVFRIPIQKIDNLPVVFDSFTSYTYLVTPQAMFKLYQHEKTYIIKDVSSRTGYNIVNADSSGKLSFTPYLQDPKNLQQITRTFLIEDLKDSNNNKIVKTTNGGVFLILTEDAGLIQYSYAYRDANNFPIVFNHFSGQAFLLTIEPSNLIYPLEKLPNGIYVIVDQFTNERINFKMNDNGDAVIINP